MGFILFMLFNSISSYVSSALWCLPWFPLTNVIFVFIYASRYPETISILRLPYQIMLVLFNSNTTGVTIGAGTTYPSVAPESLLVFNGVRVVHFLIICVAFCRPSLSLLSFSLRSCIVCLLFELRLLITSLISLNLPLTIAGLLDSYMCIHGTL